MKQTGGLNRLLSVFFLAVCYLLPLLSYSQQTNANQPYNKEPDAMVHISAYTTKDSLTSQGSGIIITDSGLIVTNYSTIAGGQKIVIKQQGKTVKHSGIIGVDIEKNLAFLKLEKGTAAPLTIENNVAENIKHDLWLTTTTSLLPVAVLWKAEKNDDRTNGLIPLDRAVMGSAVLNNEGHMVGITTIFRLAGKQMTFVIPNNEIWKVKRMHKDSINTNALLLLYQGLNAYDDGDYETAHGYLTKSIKAGRQNAVAHYYRGNCRVMLKNYADAVGDYFAASNQSYRSARVYAASGNAYKIMKNYKEAVQDFTWAIEIEPRNAALYLNRGICKGSLKDKAGARSDFEKAVELNPENGEAYYYLATEMLVQKDFMNAIQHYNKAVYLHFENAALYYNRGIAHQELKSYKNALEDFSRAIELNTGLVGAYINRANIKYLQKDFTGAIKDLDAALGINPNFTDAWHNRGNAKAELKDYAGAMTDYNMAIKLTPENAQTWYVRGNTKQQLGDMSGACFDWSKAGELGMNEAYATIKANCK